MRSHKSMIAFVATGAALAMSVAFAQDDKKQDQTARGDSPGPVHKRLAELAGTWDVSTRYVIGDKEREGKATCEAKMILGGRFLQQDYDSLFQGQPFHVLQLLGYDNARKKSIEIMLDTMGTGMRHNEGTVSDDGNVITNVGESIDSQSGKPYKLHTVTTITDRDNFTLEWFRADDSGKQSKVVTLTHKRRK
jgi:Protein of unknown function (DUF1579)